VSTQAVTLALTVCFYPTCVSHTVLQGIEIAGALDLFLVASREGYVEAVQPIGLAAITELMLGTPLPKDPKIRRSNWGLRPLSLQQLQYAACDALAGFDTAAELFRRSEVGSCEISDSVAMFEWTCALLDQKVSISSCPAFLQPSIHLLATQHSSTCCPAYNHLLPSILAAHSICGALSSSSKYTLLTLC
jgi:hypothetical protein